MRRTARTCRSAAITGELYFAHADKDHSMPQEQIDLLEAALDAAGVRYRSEIYPGAEHGFTMADTAAYTAEAEKRHWVKLFELLEDTAAHAGHRRLGLSLLVVEQAREVAAQRHHVVHLPDAGDPAVGDRDELGDAGGPERGHAVVDERRRDRRRSRRRRR